MSYIYIKGFYVKSLILKWTKCHGLKRIAVWDTSLLYLLLFYYLWHAHEVCSEMNHGFFMLDKTQSAHFLFSLSLNAAISPGENALSSSENCEEQTAEQL